MLVAAYQAIRYMLDANIPLLKRMQIAEQTAKTLRKHLYPEPSLTEGRLSAHEQGGRQQNGRVRIPPAHVPRGGRRP